MLLTEIKAIWQHLNPILQKQLVLDNPITPEKQDLDLKSLVMILVEEHMKDTHKEIQEKMDQKLEALTRETQKSLKEIQENTKANKEETKNHLKKYRRTLINRQKS